jgi:hypothetical protein
VVFDNGNHQDHKAGIFLDTFEAAGKSINLIGIV